MQDIIKNFERNGFSIKTFDTKNQAKEYLLSEINHTTVTFGGSVTLANMGLYYDLKENNETFYHAVDGIHKTGSKVYISSANALSKDGQIVNVDGFGNRVAGTIYGADCVYIVCGMNKMCDNLQDAMFRARNVAGPLNARRLNKNTPCAKGELRCYNCNSEDRICRATVIIDKKPTSIQKYEIILINDSLGY